MFIILLVIGFVLFSVLIIMYNWQRRHLYALASQLEGPMAFPLIGNAYVFLGAVDDYLLKIVKILRKYKGPVKFWLGPSLLISFSNPKHIEKILLSNKVTHKHDVYEFLKAYGGEGLISTSGPKWKAGRKLIQPLYNVKFVSSALETFPVHMETLISNMDQYIDKDAFCVEKIIHPCVIDIVSESIMGIETNCQIGKNKELTNAVTAMYHTVVPRIFRPWLYSDSIYNLTQRKRDQDTQVATIQNFFGNIAKLGHSVYNNQKLLEIEEKRNYPTFEPSLRELTKKFAHNELGLTENDFIDNLFTLFAASEDTVSIICSSACVCFGMYPHYQEKAYQEVSSILENTQGYISPEDVAKMHYLDMCVKDVLRLFPIAPFIIRKVEEEFEIDKWKIPPNCAILIPIFLAHLDENCWEKPMDFHPNHFLSEQVEKRPTFSYIPFSAGPRGCIGKTFAQTSIKVILARILQRYIIEANGTYGELFQQLRADISVRSRIGYFIKIKKRVQM